MAKTPNRENNVSAEILCFTVHAFSSRFLKMWKFNKTASKKKNIKENIYDQYTGVFFFYFDTNVKWSYKRTVQFIDMQSFASYR